MDAEEEDDYCLCCGQKKCEYINHHCEYCHRDKHCTKLWCILVFAIKELFT
jgi:hypothetical protein